MTPSTTPERPLAARLLRWHRRHGRFDLPWQLDPTPYRVWVSEIMLQQTQVTTVVGYFDRFMEAFPDLADLAAATNDRVMALWAGLGYYSRARNLHQAAQICVERHQGKLPDNLESLMDLPGIGRSTGGAIMALAHGQRHPILDGNVKRVLARFHAVAGWPGRTAVARTLWALADQHTPDQQVPAYTQAIMDLGAIVCTPRNPRCGDCPVSEDCQARTCPEAFPEPRPRKPVPRRNAVLLVILDADNRILLQRRPPSGIWGGLWSLPQFDDLEQARTRYAGRALTAACPFDHAFTHFHLTATPWRFEPTSTAVADADDLSWFEPGETDALGIPTPVRKWLQQFKENRIQWLDKSTV